MSGTSPTQSFFVAVVVAVIVLVFQSLIAKFKCRTDPGDIGIYGVSLVRMSEASPLPLFPPLVSLHHPQTPATSAFLAFRVICVSN